MAYNGNCILRGRGSGCVVVPGQQTNFKEVVFERLCTRPCSIQNVVHSNPSPSFEYVYKKWYRHYHESDARKTPGTV
jgi:hypothetical protein